MITFAIPTWNRADKLRVCLDSIVSQIIDDRIKIAIYNNASDDNTEEVIEEFKRIYPTVFISKTGTEHVVAQESFIRAFSMPTSKYMWMFGDDDILLPGGLRTVIDVLQRKEPDFIHVAEFTRVANENRSYFATTLDLCCGFGFVEMTGFISGNICRTEPFQSVLNSADMLTYQTSSFMQSCMILDAFSDSKACFINAPIIDNQEREQTIESCTRWQAENVQLNYALVANGLDLLRSKGKVGKTLPVDFFRYLTGNLIGKSLFNFHAHAEATQDYVDEKYWDAMNLMASFLDDEGKTLKVIADFKASFNAYIKHNKKTHKLMVKLQQDHDKSTEITYPFSYT